MSEANGTRKVVKVAGPRSAGRGQAWDLTFASGPDGDTMSDKAAAACQTLCDAGEEATFEFESRPKGDRTYYTVTKITKADGTVAYDKAAGGNRSWSGGGGGGGGEPRDETAIMAQVAVKEAGTTVRERLRMLHQRPLVEGQAPPPAPGEMPSSEDLAKEIAVASIRIARGLADATLVIKAILGAGQAPIPAAAAANGASVGQARPAPTPVAPAASNGNGRQEDPDKARLAELWARAEAHFGGRVRTVKGVNEALGTARSSKEITIADLERALGATTAA